jgi:copper ion binding protein
MSKANYSIPAIHCHHCVHTIEMELGEIKGVKNIKADVNAKTVEIEFSEPATEELIIGTLREIEYPPEVK